MKACLYKLECAVTSKFYIGSTIHTLKYRLKKRRLAREQKNLAGEG
jgi:hypothetical protein